MSDTLSAYIARMTAEYARLKAWWAAKPDKVFLIRHQQQHLAKPDPRFAYVTDEARIDWRTAEAISGVRVDRRRAYFIHDDKVMMWLFDANDGLDGEGIPLIGLRETAAEVAR